MHIYTYKQILKKLFEFSSIVNSFMDSIRSDESNAILVLWHNVEVREENLVKKSPVFMRFIEPTNQPTNQPPTKPSSSDDATGQNHDGCLYPRDSISVPFRALRAFV